jgi:DNA repair protein RadA/Sms
MMTPRLKEASKLGFARAVLPENGEVDVQGMKLSLSRIAHLKSLAEATVPCD